MIKYLVTLFIFLYTLSAIADDYSNAWKDYATGKYDIAMQTFDELEKNGNVYSQAIVGVHHAAKFRYIDDKEPDPYNPIETLASISKLQKSGDLEATFLPALMHDEGWAVSKDDSIAKKLYLVAAKAGHTGAQVHIAEYYEIGIAGDKDIKKAIYWYKKASDNGDVFAKQMVSNLSK